MLFLSVSWLCSCWFLGQADRCVTLACSQNQGRLLYFPVYCVLLCLVLLNDLFLRVFLLNSTFKKKTLKILWETIHQWLKYATVSHGTAFRLFKAQL